MTEEEKPPKKLRGFALMNKEKLREISRKGGESAHLLGTAHQFKSGEEAQAAGRKGGQKNKDKKRAREAEKQIELPFDSTEEAHAQDTR